VTTPKAQCAGEHTFRYALVPHSGSWQSVSDQAHAFNAPLRVAQCNLAEEELEELAVGTDGSVSARARGREIVTLLARF
jgi:alpha-mannosidase